MQDKSDELLLKQQIFKITDELEAHRQDGMRLLRAVRRFFLSGFLQPLLLNCHLLAWCDHYSVTTVTPQVTQDASGKHKHS